MSGSVSIHNSRSNANGRANISLYESTSHNNLKGVRDAITNGANVNTKFENDWTALHRSAQFGYLDICKELLTKNATLECLLSSGWTPLHIAASNGHSTVVELLLQKKSDINATDECKLTSLMLACMHGDIPTVKILLANKADVFAVSKNNRSSVIMAINRGHDAIVEMLLSAEDAQELERYQKKKEMEEHSLHTARESMMLQNTACGIRKAISVQDQTALDEKLWQSAKSGYLDGVRTAIEAGGNPHQKTLHQIDAMEAARSSGNRRCYAFLRAYELSHTLPPKYWSRQDVLRYIEGNLPLSIATNHILRELNKIPKLNGNIFRSAYAHHLFWHEQQLTPQQRLALCRISTALRHGFKLVQHLDESIGCISRQFENPTTMEDLRKHVPVSQFLAFCKARVNITAHQSHSRQHRHMPTLPILMRGESVEEFEADERCLVKREKDDVPLSTTVPRSAKIADRMRWWKCIEWDVKYCDDKSCDRCGVGHPFDPKGSGTFGLEDTFGQYSNGTTDQRNICHSSDARYEVTEKDPLVIRPSPNVSATANPGSMNGVSSHRIHMSADIPHILSPDHYPSRDAHVFSKVNGICQQSTKPAKPPLPPGVQKTCGYTLKHPDVKRTYRLHQLCDGLWALPALCTSQKHALRQCNNAHPGIVLKLTDKQVLTIGPYLVYALWVISQHIRANGSRLLALYGTEMKPEDIPEPLLKLSPEDHVSHEDFENGIADRAITPMSPMSGTSATSSVNMLTGNYKKKRKATFIVNVLGHEKYSPQVEEELKQVLSTPIIRPEQQPALSPHERAILSRMGISCDHRKEPILLDLPPTTATMSLLPIVFPEKLANKMRSECERQREQQEEAAALASPVNNNGQQKSRAWLALQKRIRDGDGLRNLKEQRDIEEKTVQVPQLSPLSPISTDCPPPRMNFVTPPPTPILSPPSPLSVDTEEESQSVEEKHEISTLRTKVNSMDNHKVKVLQQVITAFQTGSPRPTQKTHKRTNSNGMLHAPSFDRTATTAHPQELARVTPSSRSHITTPKSENATTPSSTPRSSILEAVQDEEEYEEKILGPFWLQQVELQSHSNCLEILNEFQRKRENLPPKEQCRPQLTTPHQLFSDDVNVLWEEEIEQAQYSLGLYPRTADAFQYESMAALFATYCTHPEELGKCIEDGGCVGVFSPFFENQQCKHTAVCEARSVLLRIIEHCDGEVWKAPTNTTGLKRVKDSRDYLDLWMCSRHADAAELVDSDRFQALGPTDRHVLDDEKHFKASPSSCSIM